MIEQSLFNCAALPKSKPYLMYGLTEAFRSTYLPPEEVDRRPDSMGKAIPNAEILVVGEDGKMVGLITLGDVVKYRLEEVKMEKDALEGMIMGF